MAPPNQARAGSVFVTTHWSVVVEAQDKDSPECAVALEKLCQAYWYPLYAHVRRLGHAPPDAEDLTQAFFARLLEKGYLRAADEARGRFRTFLLVALDRFLANEWDRTRAQERWGGCPVVPLDTGLAERLYAAQSVPESSLEREDERCWALTLLEGAVGRLRTEGWQSGRVRAAERVSDRGAWQPALRPGGQQSGHHGRGRAGDAPSVAAAVSGDLQRGGGAHAGQPAGSGRGDGAFDGSVGGMNFL